MAWVSITGIDWQYSDTPETDDPINAHNYLGRHTAGIRTNYDGTQIYVYCKQLNRTDGIGWGELNKTYYDFESAVKIYSLDFSIPYNSMYIPLI